MRSLVSAAGWSPFCHWTFRGFRSLGFDYPILTEKRVVGSYHLDDIVPALHVQRQREARLPLSEEQNSIFTESLRVMWRQSGNLARVLKRPT